MRTWPMHLDAIAAPEPPPIFLPGRLAGKEWLRSVTKSADWAATAQVVKSAMESSTSPKITGVLKAAGARVGEAAAKALAQGQTKGLSRTISRMVSSELNAVVAQYPQLAQQIDLREAAMASIGQHATEKLALSRLKFGDDLGFVSQIPFLPIFLSPHQPSEYVTALELPYRVVISPIESARWTHSDQPVTDSRWGRTELWNTRLTNSPHDFGPDADSKIRAIWSPDYPIDVGPFLEPPKPFRMSLDPLDRQMLVRLMAGYNEVTPTRPPHAYTPRPSKVYRLTLSSLAGLLDSEGSWPAPRPANPPVGLEQWRHIATLGRDQYVRVVYAGFLMPFGHHASLIKVTERKFESTDSLRHRVAVLRQRFFIIVREPVKSYANAGTVPGWFDFPLKQVEILTHITPSLVAPENAACQVDPTFYSAAVPPRAVFWPMIAPDKFNGNFQFEMAATDICGNRFTFSMPLLFIGDEANQPGPPSPGTKAMAQRVVEAYDNEPAVPRRKTTLGGAIVCFAPPQPSSQGDPRLPASSMTFSSSHIVRGPYDPHFDPHLQLAEVGIRQIQRLLNQTNAVTEVAYPDHYKNAGFGGANKGEVFLKLTSPFDLGFGGGAGQAKSDSLGALASPSMAIQGLSRIMGPVAAQPQASVEDALKNVIGNKFDPTDFFKDAKILGGILLKDLLTTIFSLAGADVPKMLSRDLPDRVEASFHWETQISKSDPANLFVPGAGGDKTNLTMDGLVSAPIGQPDAATFHATAELVHFKVNLFGFIIIWFDSLSFRAERGKKPDVSVGMHPGDDAITFGGPLEFVNDLRKFIPSNGFSDPPTLSVTPSGIAANYSLNLPNIGVGIFALTNTSLGAGFSLPFDGEPAEVKFNFSERQHPFSLTVALFGGGGFFAIGIGTEGVREIEAALEFGAAISIDLGVASGGVEVKAGIYFHWLESSGTKTVELSGYIRLHGELSVLGLISASLTFNLQLSYLKQGSKSSVWGEATLTVEIEILLFSASVSVKCRRELGGSPSDPSFAELIPAAPVWAEYCEAFVAE
jgi:hypothetical protein